MTTTTTTAAAAYADEFIADFDRYATHPRSDGIVQTRLGGKSISRSFTDYILQINTKDHTALVYSIASKSVTMKLQVLGEGPQRLLMPRNEYFKACFGCEEHPVPSMYTSWAVPDMINSDWKRISAGYILCGVHSMFQRHGQTFFQLVNMKNEPKLLVCNNAPMVFSQMLSPSGPAAHPDHYKSLPITTLFDLYKALANAELFDRLAGVSQAIQNTENRFLSMFNEEDKTMKPIRSRPAVNAAMDFAEKYGDWLKANEDTSIHCARMAMVTIEGMQEYYDILNAWSPPPFKRPASEISADTESGVGGV